MSLEAIKYHKGQLSILDQLLLPHQSVYLTIKNTKDGWNSIKKMQVCCSLLTVLDNKTCTYKKINYRCKNESL